MSFPTNVTMPIAAPYGVRVEYSLGVSATSIGAPSPDAALSGRGASGDEFLSIPHEQYARWADGAHGPRGRLRAGTSDPATQVRGVGAMMPVVSQLGAIATVAMNVMLTLRTTAGETSV